MQAVKRRFRTGDKTRGKCDTPVVLSGTVGAVLQTKGARVLLAWGEHDMRKRMQMLIVVIAGLTVGTVHGATRYVWRNNPSPQPPFTNWTTAATEIQQAVNLSTTAGDVVLVTNGVYNTGGAVTPGYALANRVCATNAITIRSLATDPTKTVIVGAPASTGGHGTNAVRCVYLAGGASLTGFTLTGGYTQTNRSFYQNSSGGGVFMNSGSVVSNCLIATNAAANHGGGVVCYYGGTLARCEIATNQTSLAGGGAFCFYGGAVNNCGIWKNIALSGNSQTGNGGGGVFCTAEPNVTGAKGGVLTACKIYGNRATGVGGGVHYYRAATTRVLSCVITNNVAGGSGGGVQAWIGGGVSNCLVAYNRSNSTTTSAGGVYLYSGAVLENSIVSSNYSANIGGGVYNRGGTVNNCLIAGNTAKKNGGGLAYAASVAGTSGGTVKNCTLANNVVETANAAGGVTFLTFTGTLQSSIVWGNNASNIVNSYTPTISYTCSSPAPGGTQNFADDPLFVNTNRANYRLSSGSRCINTGFYETWMATGVDVQGQKRLRFGAVDRGALEYYPFRTTVIVR